MLLLQVEQNLLLFFSSGIRFGEAKMRFEICVRQRTEELHQFFCFLCKKLRAFYDSVAFVQKISVCWTLFGLVHFGVSCFNILSLSVERSAANIAHAFINREVNFMLQLLIFSTPSGLVFFALCFAARFHLPAK